MEPPIDSESTLSLSTMDNNNLPALHTHQSCYDSTISEPVTTQVPQNVEVYGFEHSDLSEKLFSTTQEIGQASLDSIPPKTLTHTEGERVMAFDPGEEMWNVPIFSEGRDSETELNIPIFYIHSLNERLSLWASDVEACMHQIQEEMHLLPELEYPLFDKEVIN